jgi:hypothetical protein
MQQLFPQSIPIIGVAGEHASGKTLFGATICPGPQTLIYDSEKSSETYRGLGFDRVDIPAELQRKHPKGYKPIDAFMWWLESVRAIPADKYRVIVLDVATDVEIGAVDWVRANPGYFSRTAAQYARMSGLVWGDMKELWKAILADIASRCQTFVFAVHMADVWVGDRPSGRRRPRGKSTLLELASLFLCLERCKDGKGNQQTVPSAVVLKSRLAHTHVNAATGVVEIVPALPPRLPAATPDAIRAYLLQPPDYRKLTKDERAPEAVLTDDDRAQIKLQTAEAEAEAARLQLEKLERQERALREAKERREAAPVAAATPRLVTTSLPPAGPAQPAPAAPPQANAAPAPDPTPATPTPQINNQQLMQLQGLRSEFFTLAGVAGDQDRQRELWGVILTKRGVTTARDLSEPQAVELIANLKARVEHLHEEKRGSGPVADNF